MILENKSRQFGNPPQLNAPDGSVSIIDTERVQTRIFYSYLIRSTKIEGHRRPLGINPVTHVLQEIKCRILSRFLLRLEHLNLFPPLG